MRGQPHLWRYPLIVGMAIASRVGGKSRARRPFHRKRRGEPAFLGFRVAYVPEPAALCFLALGGLAVMRRRR